jgi:hypothetical protein
MGGVRRSASRLAVAAMVMSGLLLHASTISARAATPVASGRNSAGDVYVTGPAKIIKRLCPSTSRTGFVCLFSGLNETGQGVAVLRGNHALDSKCDDLPAGFVVSNVDNDTDEPIELGDGTCANRGPIIDADVEPGVDENIQPTDIWITHA